MRIERFDSKRHKRSGFCSGNRRLDEYLQKHISQGIRKNLVKAYVAVDDELTVIGYYTLSSSSVRHEIMPEPEARKLPKYPVPAILIGRMASDKKVRKSGLKIGSRLLIHALKQALLAADTVGVMCVIVDAKPEAAGFYQRFGFTPLKQEQGISLYLPIQTVRAMQING